MQTDVTPTRGPQAHAPLGEEADAGAGSPWDVLIRNALLFDGSGQAPRRCDVAISGRRVAALGDELPAERAREVIDADGLWLMPGLLDIHTHLDLEVEVNPGLPEAVRHGSTTVIVGNCSLGTAFGAQLRNGDNPILDCFTRVENMPKRVLQKCIDRIHWNNTADYLAHFADIPLGPNIAPLLPHSMLRTEVMGVEASISREPTADEMARMHALLEAAMEQGYIGFSTDGIVFHYLANDPHKEKRIPTQFASNRELKSLLDVVRRHDRVWQVTPDSQSRGTTLRRFLWTSGRLYGKPLKVSALTAIDFKPTPKIWKSLLGLARFLNSPLIQGRFHFQTLATNFRMWSDGAVAPFFEEFESTRAWIACEVEDVEGRMRLVNDPAWIAQFHRDWKQAEPQPKTLFNRLGIGLPTTTFVLDPDEMFFDGCPVAAWQGESFRQVFERLQRYRSGDQAMRESAARDDDERHFFEHCGPVETMADFFLAGLRAFDRRFRWWMDTANCRPDVLREMLFNPHTLPGFNDSGAHITNLAFYDGNLLTLKIAAEESLERVAEAVHRLTRAPADFFGLDVGRLEPGAQADLVLIDPEALAHYDSNANRQLVYHELFENDCLVNRSDGVVREVYIAGTRVWEEGARFTPALGRETLGRALRAV